MATIRDVAKRAGVSTATVSHVINGTRFVMPETKKLVLEAIRETNYRPSALARSLSTNQTKTIGVVIADVTSPFFASLLRHIERRLSAEGYNIILCNTYEQPAKEAGQLGLLLDKRVDGVIVTPTGAEQAMYAEFSRQNVPIVFVDRHPPFPEGAFVGTDNEKAAYESTRYLIKLGHRRIGLVTLDTATTPVTARLAGYQKAIQKFVPDLEDNLTITVKADMDEAAVQIQELLSRANPPTAIIAGSHVPTLGALKALRTLNLTYPDDVSLVCFDNSRWTSVVTPSLTAVTKPISELAEAAMNIMLEALNEIEQRRKDRTFDGVLPTKQLLLDTQLIKRESCRPLHNKRT